jgi:hypothetical protein
VVPSLMSELRRQHPALIGRIWAQLADRLAEPAFTTLWPHAANDLLLGMPRASEAELAALCGLVGHIGFDEAIEQTGRVSALSAITCGSQSEQLFSVAPVKLRGLHAVLMRTEIADAHGTLLHRALARRPLDELTAVLMNGIDRYEPDDRLLFQSLLREAGRGVCSTRLREQASSLLMRVLEELSVSERAEAWTPGAITWLGRLDRERAAPLLRRVIGERRWLVRRSWPAACRAAASTALSGVPVVRADARAATPGRV